MLYKRHKVSYLKINYYWQVILSCHERRAILLRDTRSKFVQTTGSNAHAGDYTGWLRLLGIIQLMQNPTGQESIFGLCCTIMSSAHKQELSPRLKKTKLPSINEASVKTGAWPCSAAQFSRTNTDLEEEASHLGFRQRRNDSAGLDRSLKSSSLQQSLASAYTYSDQYMHAFKLQGSNWLSFNGVSRDCEPLAWNSTLKPWQTKSEAVRWLSRWKGLLINLMTWAQPPGPT